MASNVFLHSVTEAQLDLIHEIKRAAFKANPRALEFHRRLGFRVTGETETHYHLLRLG
ncbi:MAG: hypothetical protein ACO1SV_03015 [Fimbriimonas sp.]